MKFSEICEAERPREKLLSRGPGALSDAELLAILIRTGTVEGSALDVAHKLLFSTGGSLLAVSKMPLKDLCAIPGIKKGKAPAIISAFELGRRFMNESSFASRDAVKSPDKIYKMMLPHLKGLSWEECWILLLNNAQFPVGKVRMSSGGGESTVIDKKDIIREALERKAKYIILVHNHPTGNPTPSNADIQMTQELMDAAKAVGLVLLDHIVVCDDCYYSFSEDTQTRAL